MTFDYEGFLWTYIDIPEMNSLSQLMESQGYTMVLVV